MGLLVMLGVFMIVPDFTLENNVTAGVLFGLLSALAVALRNILVSKHLSDISPFTIMFYHAMVSAAILLPFASVSPVEMETPDLLALILLGTVFTAIPHTQKTYALRYRSAKSVSMVTSLPTSVLSLNSIPIPSKTSLRRTITSFSSLNSGIPKVSSPPISG